MRRVGSRRVADALVGVALAARVAARADASPDGHLGVERPLELDVGFGLRVHLLGDVEGGAQPIALDLLSIDARLRGAGDLHREGITAYFSRTNLLVEEQLVRFEEQRAWGATRDLQLGLGLDLDQGLGQGWYRGLLRKLFLDSPEGATRCRRHSVDLPGQSTQ